MNSNLGPQFSAHSQPMEINAAIDSYPKHIRKESGGETRAPYNAESLAEIYQPRVQQLMDLQNQGFTHARWGFDREQKENRWHGHTPESSEVKKQPRPS